MLLPLWDTAAKTSLTEALLTPGHVFFLSVSGSGSYDGWAWCAVSTVTQSSLPLPEEGDLFKILLQSSEPRRCHGRPKAERDTEGELRQSHWTHFWEISKSQSLYVALQRRLLSVGSAHRASEIKRIKAAKWQ